MRAYPAASDNLSLAEGNGLGKAELLAMLRGVMGYLVFPLCTLSSDLPASSGCAEDGLLSMLAGALASALKTNEGGVSSRVLELCGCLINQILLRVGCPHLPFLAAFLIPRLGAGSTHCAMASMELCIQLCDQLQFSDESGGMRVNVLASCHVVSVLQLPAKAFLKEPIKANAILLLRYVMCATSFLLPGNWRDPLVQWTAGQRLLLLLLTSPLLDMLASTPFLMHDIEEGDWLWQAAEEFPLVESYRDSMTGHFSGTVWPVWGNKTQPKSILIPLNVAFKSQRLYLPFPLDECCCTSEGREDTAPGHTNFQ